MSYSPKNMLVTGAAGFIGSNYVRMILSQHSNIRIVSYDKLTYASNLDNLKNLNNQKNHTFVEGDICDETLVYRTLKTNNIDTILHFAAESHVDNSIASPKIFLETNIIGTFTLLNQAKKFWIDEQHLDKHSCRFHHISTDEVYGALSTKKDPAFTETKAYEPNSPYSASKASSDHIARAYIHTYKLPITISNCSNNYGPYQHHEKFIPLVINKCIQQKPIPIYGDGSNIRDWLYIKDHCEAIQMIVTKGIIGETYNIGGMNEVDNLSLVNTICELMDNYQPEYFPHNKLISFVEDRKGHDWRYAIDISKIQNDLGWKPSQNFNKMLKQTVEFYLK